MWNPPIVKTVATENKGIEDLSAAIESYYEFQTQAHSSRERREAIARWRLTELLQERLLADFLKQNGTGDKLEKLAVEIAEKKSDPYSAIDQLLTEK